MSGIVFIPNIIKKRLLPAAHFIALLNARNRRPVFFNIWVTLNVFNNQLVCICVIFLGLWQNTWEKQFKGRNFYFGSWFQRFLSMMALLFLVWGEAEHHGGKQVVEQRYLFQKERETKRERIKERLKRMCHGAKYTFQRYPFNDLLPPTRLTRESSIK
jgi:hypothetical protein